MYERPDTTEALREEILDLEVVAWMDPHNRRALSNRIRTMNYNQLLALFRELGG